MRKGQIEFIGLVVIVILIVLGLVFYIKFGILGKKVSEIGPAYQTVFASNTLNTMLSYVPMPGDKDMGDFLMDCSYGLAGVCNYPKEEVSKILEVILKKGDFEEYYFYSSNEEGIFIEIDENCKNKNGITSPEYFIGSSKFVLKLCK